MTKAASDAVRYMVIVGLTISVATGAFASALWGLDLADRKPPPAFTNSYCIDSKMAFLRENPPREPTHLIVGSSIGWRNIAGEAIVEANPDARPLNGAFCGLPVNQSLFAAQFLLHRYPSITQVLLLVDPFDMSTCRSSKTGLFDVTDVSDYLTGLSDIRFYFKYFDVFALLTNAFGSKTKFTPHGDGPQQSDEYRGLVYGPAPSAQPECQVALSRFAADVEASRKRLIVVTMPLLAAWSDRYDRDSKARGQLATEIRGALAGRSAVFWDAWSKAKMQSADYTDAVHLSWKGALGFTRQLIHETGFGARSE